MVLAVLAVLTKLAQYIKSHQHNGGFFTPLTMNSMRITSLFLLFLSLFMNGCTQKSQDVNATVNEALFGFKGVNKSHREIAALAYASSYAVINEGAQVFMVLAFAAPSDSTPGQTRLKWLSADYAMLATENGRLVKTLGLPADNLMGISAKHSKDPLTIAGKKPANHTWSAVYDWQPDYRFNYTANLNWSYIARQTIHSDAWEKETDYYQERVTIPSLKIHFTNHFWLDTDTHQVVKSIQHIGPEMAAIEMTILKPFSG